MPKPEPPSDIPLKLGAEYLDRDQGLKIQVQCSQLLDHSNKVRQLSSLSHGAGAASGHLPEGTFFGL